MRTYSDFCRYWLRAATLCAIVLVFIGGSPVQAQTLGDAVRRAVATNPTIKSSSANRRAANYVLDQATGRLMPQISMSASLQAQKIDRPEGISAGNNTLRPRREVSARIRQVVFDGWDRANQIYKSEARIDSAAMRVLAASEAVGLDAVETYIDVLRHRRLLRVAAANIKRHKEILSLVDNRYRGGISPISDLDQTKERLAGAQAVHAEIRAALQSAEARYAEVVGKRPGRLRSIPIPDHASRGLQKSVNNALAHNSILLALRSDIVAAEYERNQSKSDYYPQVYLEGEAIYGKDIDGTPGRNNELRGGVVLSWNLFDGRVRTARVGELSERVVQRVADLERRERDVIKQIENSWAKYTNGHVEVAALKRQEASNSKIIRTYLDEYQLSKRSILDVLDAENTRFRVRFELSSASAITRFAIYQVVALTGQLLDIFGVEAPKEAIPFSNLAPARSLGGNHDLVIKPLR